METAQEKQNSLKFLSILFYIFGGLTVFGIGFMIKFFFDMQQAMRLAEEIIVIWHQIQH